MRRAVFLFLFAAGTAGADASKQLVDDGWRFHLGDPPAAEAVDYDDSGWRHLDLPHDWGVEGRFDGKNPSAGRGGYLPTGIGWYRKTISVQDAWRGKRLAIEFEGVFRNSTVWVNGEKLGFRPYGWITFEYDLTSTAASSDELTIAVRVDNSKQHAARWYTGSGIYGHVWLKIRPLVYIPTSGVWVRTKGDKVLVETEVKNAGTQNATSEAATEIVDADGRVVASAVERLTVAADGLERVTQQLEIEGARRWSPEDPYLYRVVSRVRAAVGQEHRVETRLGVRDIEWKPGDGLFLNGKSLKLRGVCQHQHGGALGAAVPDKIIRFRIEQMKRMGCNSIRTAHNPHTPAFYHLCDELGVIVMDEFVDGWKRKARHDYGTHHFAAWWRRDLTDWVKRDRNHPSVFLWSMGNETEGEVGRDMVALCHELDPSRLVTSGSSGSEFMDIYGMNGGSEGVGWFDRLSNDRVFIGTENTHTWQTRGYYRTQTWYRDGPIPQATKIPDLTDAEIFTVDWTDNSRRQNRKQFYKSSYDNATVRSPARRAIAQIRDVPNNAGMYRWTGHDYLGEADLASGGWPFKVFSGGACDLANFEKDLYHLYRSQWTTDPMVHILPHWTHPAMMPGTEIPVWVYSNCDRVELLLNDRSLGKQEPGADWREMQCEWLVGWQPGELRAVGYRAGRPVAEQRVRTATEPVELSLTVDGAPLRAQGKDIVQVRISFVDRDGGFYPYGENRLWFHLDGPGRIRALDNGKPNDTEPFFGTDSRAGFMGLARAYVESAAELGPVVLTVGAILGDKKLYVADQVHIDVKQINLRGGSAAENHDVFYTVDGSEPSVDSLRYEGPFSLPLGNTVKALVTRNGQPVLRMEERFAEDVGLLWRGGGSDEGFGGEQAEEARVSGGTISDEGRNFNGRGFVALGSKPGAFVEWYRENDGDPADATAAIRYRTGAAAKAESRIDVNVNGETNRIRLTPTSRGTAQWGVVRVPIKLQRGANTVRVAGVDGQAVLIDEIAFESQVD